MNVVDFSGARFVVLNDIMLLERGLKGLVGAFGVIGGSMFFYKIDAVQVIIQDMGVLADVQIITLAEAVIFVIRLEHVSN